MYIGCHRFDQSALAMILIREFELQVWDLTVDKKAKAVLHVERRHPITNRFIAERLSVLPSALARGY